MSHAIVPEKLREANPFSRKFPSSSSSSFSCFLHPPSLSLSLWLTLLIRPTLAAREERRGRAKKCSKIGRSNLGWLQLLLENRPADRPPSPITPRLISIAQRGTCPGSASSSSSSPFRTGEGSVSQLSGRKKNDQFAGHELARSKEKSSFRPSRSDL